jgi:predicted Zn-dependent protease
MRGSKRPCAARPTHRGPGPLAAALAIATSLIGGVAGAASWEDWLAISEEQELALGKELAKQVEVKLPMVADPAVLSAVNRLGQDIARSSTRPNLVYTFRVVDVAEVNAFALPGGHVYVQRGLLDAAKSEMELAGVLAHEVGHVAARHGAKQAGRARLLEGGMGLLTGILGGGSPQGQDQGKGQGQGGGPSLTEVAINLLATGVLLKYSRVQEDEADDLGFTTTVGAGYDPRGMIFFLQTLQAMQKNSPGALAQLFATHPPSDERIHALSARWWTHRPPEGLTVDTDGFRRLKAHLAALPPPKPMPKDPPEAPKR